MAGLGNVRYHIQFLDFLRTFSANFRIIRSRYEISGVLDWMEYAFCVLLMWENEDTSLLLLN